MPKNPRRIAQKELIVGARDSARWIRGPVSEKRTYRALARKAHRPPDKQYRAGVERGWRAPETTFWGECQGQAQVASSETLSGYSHLFRFDASGFDYTRGAFTLALHEASELGLGHGHWIGPALREPVAQVWRSQGACDVIR